MMVTDVQSEKQSNNDNHCSSLNKRRSFSSIFRRHSLKVHKKHKQDNVSTNLDSQIPLGLVQQHSLNVISSDERMLVKQSTVTTSTATLKHQSKFQTDNGKTIGLSDDPFDIEHVQNHMDRVSEDENNIQLDAIAQSESPTSCATDSRSRSFRLIVESLRQRLFQELGGRDNQKSSTKTMHEIEDCDQQSMMPVAMSKEPKNDYQRSSVNSTRSSNTSSSKKRKHFWQAFTRKRKQKTNNSEEEECKANTQKKTVESVCDSLSSSTNNLLLHTIVPPEPQSLVFLTTGYCTNKDDFSSNERQDVDQNYKRCTVKTTPTLDDGKFHKSRTGLGSNDTSSNVTCQDPFLIKITRLANGYLPNPVKPKTDSHTLSGTLTPPTTEQEEQRRLTSKNLLKDFDFEPFSSVAFKRSFSTNHNRLLESKSRDAVETKLSTISENHRTQTVTHQQTTSPIQNLNDVNSGKSFLDYREIPSHLLRKPVFINERGKVVEHKNKLSGEFRISNISNSGSLDQAQAQNDKTIEKSNLSRSNNPLSSDKQLNSENNSTDTPVDSVTTMSIPITPPKKTLPMLLHQSSDPSSSNQTVLTTERGKNANLTFNNGISRQSNEISNGMQQEQKSVLDGLTYKQMLNSVVARFESKCVEYEKILQPEQNKLSQTKEEQDSTTLPRSVIDDETLGIIQSAVGQARLLLRKKLRQFEKLCDANIKGPSDATEPTTTNEDLAGYWDMVCLQIKQCQKAFDSVDCLRQSGWRIHSAAISNNNLNESTQRATKHTATSAAEEGNTGLASPASANRKVRKQNQKSQRSVRTNGQQTKAHNGGSPSLREFIKQKRQQLQTEEDGGSCNISSQVDVVVTKESEDKPRLIADAEPATSFATVNSTSTPVSSENHQQSDNLSIELNCFNGVHPVERNHSMTLIETAKTSNTIEPIEAEYF